MDFNKDIVTQEELRIREGKRFYGYVKQRTEEFMGDVFLRYVSIIYEVDQNNVVVDKKVRYFDNKETANHYTYTYLALRK